MPRLIFSLLGLSLIVFLTASHRSAAQQREGQPTPDRVDPAMPLFLTCARDCDECARTCELAAAHCLTMLADGRKEIIPTLRTCQDCAAICAAASRIIAKDGPLAEVIAASCQEACKRCAVLCEKSSDTILQDCSKACRRCEKCCGDMPRPTKTPAK